LAFLLNTQRQILNIQLNLSLGFSREIRMADKNLEVSVS
jgi:hypothetical protein